MALDLSDPVTTRFIARLVALPASAWDAIDGRVGVVMRAHPPTPPPRVVARAVELMTRVLGALDPSPETVRYFAGRFHDRFDVLATRTLGPAWRRQGTGPTRLLLEVLERPYVTRPSRTWVVLTLMMAQGRGWAGDDAALREVYAPFEPEIPWASLLPPLLPGTTGASGASPPTA